MAASPSTPPSRLLSRRPWATPCATWPPPPEPVSRPRTSSRSPSRRTTRWTTRTTSSLASSRRRARRRRRAASRSSLTARRPSTPCPWTGRARLPAQTASVSPSAPHRSRRPVPPPARVGSRRRQKPAGAHRPRGRRRRSSRRPAQRCHPQSAQGGRGTTVAGVTRLDRWRPTWPGCTGPTRLRTRRPMALPSLPTCSSPLTPPTARRPTRRVPSAAAPSPSARRRRRWAQSTGSAPCASRGSRRQAVASSQSTAAGARRPRRRP